MKTYRPTYDRHEGRIRNNSSTITKNCVMISKQYDISETIQHGPNMNNAIELNEHGLQCCGMKQSEVLMYTITIN